MEGNKNNNCKLEDWARNLHLIVLPNTLWGIHIDPNYKFIGFLQMDLPNLNKINVGKAIIITNDETNMAVKTSIFINNAPIHIPELLYEMQTVSDVSHLIYMLNDLKLCTNSGMSDDCRQYISLENKENDLCDSCGKVASFVDLKECEFLKNYYELQQTEVDKSDVLHEGKNMEKVSESQRKDKEKTHNCELCGKNFSTKVQLKEHSGLHTGVKPYTCEICNKSHTHRSTHHKHMMTHANIKPFLCSICGKGFCRKYHMEDHMLTHNTEKKHECKICGKRFATGSNLKIHQRTHTGDRPYICTICGKTYTTPSNLSTHIKSTHSNKKPHPCGVCEMSFVHPRMLRIHMRKHTGEKPFKCTLCGRSFAKNIHLTVHTRIHTGERPYVCTVCGKSFTTTGNLNSHKRVHHKELKNV